MANKLKLQNDEFKALDELIRALNRHDEVAVVDDDYPSVRHAYEGALANFIAAMKANGRFAAGNRYGLQIIQGT